jgi:hypothetical protein
VTRAISRSQTDDQAQLKSLRVEIDAMHSDDRSISSTSGATGDAPTDTLGLVDSLHVEVESDAFTFGRMRIDGDILIVEVSYGGGCEEHDFKLFDTGLATRSIPPQHVLRLEHDAHGDSCEAYITRELYFDLSPFRGIYSGLDRTAIRLEGLQGMTLYIF